MYRVGQSNDIHQLKKVDSLIHLGGVEISSNYKIISYSDGDIIIHALSEAIYGALSIGDLGYYFSDKDKKNKNISSKVILNHALKKLKDHNYQIVNIDMTIICEKIYISDHKEKILNWLIKNINCNHINIKATRWEEDKNIIQCNCIVLLKREK